MVQSPCFTSRLWLPIAVGLVALCGLLLSLRPMAVAASVEKQPASTVALWLTPPDTLRAPGFWALDVEAYQAAWRVQNTALEEQLAALKAQGRVVDFQPLPGWIGFTVAAPAGLPPEVRRWRQVARVTVPGEATPESLAAWWRQGLETTAATWPRSLGALHVSTLTLNLGLHSHLVSGSTPRPEPIALSLMRGDQMIASGTATPFPDGSGAYLYAATLYLDYYLCAGCGGGYYYYPVIEPGDVLEAMQAGRTFSLTVPLLTALADRSAGVVYGQAPPSTTLDACFYRYDDSSVAYQRTVTVTAAGDYWADFGGMTEVAPRDYGYVFYADEAGQHVYARYNVPFLQVGIESSCIGGVVAPRTGVTVTLRDHAGAFLYRDWGFSSPDGQFYLTSLDPQIGDTLVVTAAGQVLSMTVTILTIHPDPERDLVLGDAVPGGVVRVDLYRGPLECGYGSCSPPGDPNYRLWVTATSGTLAGAYTADFTGLADVVAGNYGVVYVTDATGFQVYRHFAVPFLRARLGNYQLTGQINGEGPVTVTVFGSSGIPRDVRFVWAYDSGYFFDSDYGESRLRLVTGDWVTVTTQDGTRIGLAVPLLTACVDRENSIVRGQAPARSRLRVSLSSTDWYAAGGGPSSYSSYEYTLWVTSTASGVYTADFSSLTTMEPWNSGAVFYVNPQGHEIYLDYRVPAVPMLRVRSGSNYVEGVLPVEEGQIVITLRDSLGQVKTTAATWSSYDGFFTSWLYTDWRPVIIEAGDTLQVAAEDALVGGTPAPFATPTPWSDNADAAGLDALVTLVIPTLTLRADPAADSLFGQAPSSVPLEVSWYGGDPWDEGWSAWVVTSTTAGSYGLDLSGRVDVERGDQIAATWTDENGNQVWVAHRLPRLEVALGDNQVSVGGPIYSPMTLTLLSASGTLLYTDTATFDLSGLVEFYLYDQHDYGPLYLTTDQTLVADLAGQTMTITLPHLTGAIEPMTSIVSGEAPPGARLMVSHDYHWWDRDYWPVTATVTGTYSVDFAGTMDVGSTSGGQVVYLHPDGHRVALRYYVPHIEVSLGYHYVDGVAPGPGVVTATLYSGDGGFKASGVDAYRYGGRFSVHLVDAQQEPVAVVSGDLVVVQAAESTMTVTVPVLTAAFDQRIGILTGVAPAGAWLRVTLGYGSRQVQVGLGGTYAMDWSDLSLQSGEHGCVSYVDGAGNRTGLSFTVPYYELYLPSVSRWM